LVKAYIHGIDSAAFDDTAYKTIKNNPDVKGMIDSLWTKPRTGAIIFD
jgi:hypothetical protein